MSLSTNYLLYSEYLKLSYRRNFYSNKVYTDTHGILHLVRYRLLHWWIWQETSRLKRLKKLRMGNPETGKIIYADQKHSDDSNLDYIG